MGSSLVPFHHCVIAFPDDRFVGLGASHGGAVGSQTLQGVSHFQDVVSGFRALQENLQQGLGKRRIQALVNIGTTAAAGSQQVSGRQFLYGFAQGGT